MDKLNQTRAYGDRRPTPPRVAALDETVAASSPVVSGAVSGNLAAPTSGVRTTVLPRVERAEGTERVVVEGKPRYQEVRHLGAGGQAQVMLTRDHDIDRVVAMKRLHSQDEASVLRFAEEVRTVGRLEHPNIMPIHDVGVDAEGQYYFVMKYVEGETLESVIEKLRGGDAAYLARYTPENRLQICIEILRGVQHAHELGILHRDLKPGNVMIGSLGEVVVMDWGLAKRVDDATPQAAAPAAPAPAEGTGRLFETQVGSVMGTPAYMSPEQASGQPLDARSDVYSLAVMFYEFLALRHPRSECITAAQMIASVVHEPVSKVQLFRDFARVGAPAALCHFVKHGIDRDPARRYPTVAAMRERLEAVRDRRAPIECHITFTQRVLAAASRWADRSPVLVALTLLGVAAGGVAGIVMLVR